MKRIFSALAAFSLILLTATMLAGPADAHVARASSVASCDGSSGQWRMSVTVINDNGYGAATISGTGISSLDGKTLKDGADKTVLVNGLTSNSHTVSGRLTWSRDGYRASFSTTAYEPAGCRVTKVDVPAAPVPTPPSCDAPGQATIPADTASIKWTLTGNVATATTKAGYVFRDGTTVKTFTENVLPQLTGAQCAGPQPPNDVQTRDVVDAPNCTDFTVTTEHKTRTREYVLSGSTWVPGPWSAWTTVSTTVVASTDQQCPPAVVTPAQPTVINDSCDGTPGGVTKGGITLPSNDANIEYTINKSNTVIYAKIVVPHVTFPSGKIDGWHFKSATVAEFYPTLVSLSSSDCLVEAVLTLPSATAGVCDTATGIVSDATLTHPDGSVGVTYSDNGLTSVATLDAGYKFGALTDGWSLNADGTATITLTVNTPTCVKDTPTPPVTTPPSTPTTPVTTPTAPSTTPNTPVTTPSTSKVAVVHHVAKKSDTPVATPKRLASTGFDSGKFGAIGALLLILGSVAMYFGTKRKGARQH